MNLQAEYSRNDFLDFLKTFIPDFNKDIRSVATKNLKVSKNITYLGESASLDDLMVFELTHTPTKARVSLATDGFKIMKESGCYRALMIYQAEDSSDWRLSLLTATLETTEKGKVKKSFSNPRRYSFFLGPEAKINTPNKFLITQGGVENFEDLQKRFSLEVVNKEFYKQISTNFTKLVGGTLGKGRSKKTYNPLLILPELTGQSQKHSEFAVRLIGRIIFCWFLREKKSKNNKPLIPKALLSYDAIKNNQDYYHSVLEPIFFEVLNKPKNSRIESFSTKLFAHIPYLNGGLFSPHDDDYYRRMNSDFQSKYHNTLKIPDDWLETLFEILETYNFTIDENTSFDEELSIDPEMLGRIFENLLAEINPETGESARKSTGSYYTPRIIVDYMVDESLILYLKKKTKINESKLRALVSYDLTDDLENPLSDAERGEITTAIENLKLLDPACGSGAFPIGALQKIVFILQQIDPDGKLWFQKQIKNTSPEIKRVIEREFEHKNFDYIRKLGIIRKNIYGIDIQPIATEISRLRCFLTLIVDQYVDDKTDNRGIQPLPNLDFKFVTANTLISLPKTESAQPDMFENYQMIDELKDIRDQYFNASGIEREQIKAEFATQQTRIFKDLQKKHGWTGVAKAELTDKLTDWEPFKHKSTPWFDSEWMFGIKNGFDIVIANPPYLGFHGVKKIRKILSNNYKSAKGKFDLYIVFLERGLQLLSKNGCMVYICPTNFMKRNHGEALRKLLSNYTTIREIIDFGHEQIFDSVTNYTGIFLLENNISAADHHIKYKKNINGKVILYPQIKLGKQTWVIRPKHIETIIEKIKSNPSLETISSDISEGIVTGSNKFYLLSENEIANSNFEKKYFQKCVRGKEIKRNTIKSTGYFVFYPYINVNNKTTIISEGAFKKECPVYFQYLESHKNELLDREYFVKSNKKWYELWNQRSLDIHKIDKIITPELSDRNNFAIANQDIFYGDTVCGITLTKNSKIPLETLTAILNSKLIEFYYKSITVPKAGGYYIYKVMYLKNIPIVLPSNKIINELKELQLKIMKNPSQSSCFEKKINQIVYNLYNLTPDEIRIVKEDDYV